ncbi:MAG: hypothetical protein HYX62_05715 [Gammaproteobacteria bacterium]|nr:hypothetical protein [Gammaproteobacteria bacterium]
MTRKPAMLKSTSSQVGLRCANPTYGLGHARRGSARLPLHHPTFTGTSTMVSLPKMSITFTATVWRPFAA